ncbi:hypothetical protein G7085_20285 [Tessaracoccus sp. HDW20]|uniref:hypothetical protein n=1 Tax=Tessaracoccus coleopterorum TaxID=2714950 RepID=UPI0018D3D794|nr:hypothetical protein [Tessaracoccus coleopterorum]NHB86069.1 hypothetical protein [Tessaracoccus coleopterorum]
MIKATALLNSFDPIRDQNNAALGYLAAGGLVFLLVLVPEALEELGAALSPPMAAENGTAFPISQPTGLIALTDPALDEDDMALVMSWLESMRLVRMPAAEGLTPADLELFQGLFEGGADPAAIRTLVPEGPNPAFLEQAANHEQDAMAEAGRYREAGDLIGAGLMLTHQGRQHFQNGDFEGRADCSLPPSSRLAPASIATRRPPIELASASGACTMHVQRVGTNGQLNLDSIFRGHGSESLIRGRETATTSVLSRCSGPSNLTILNSKQSCAWLSPRSIS